MSLGQPGLVAGASCQQPAGGGDACPGTAPLPPAAPPGNEMRQCLGTSWHRTSAMRPWKGCLGKEGAWERSRVLLFGIVSPVPAFPLGLTGLDHGHVSPPHLEEAPAQGSTAKVGRAGKEEGGFHSA